MIIFCEYLGMKPGMKKNFVCNCVVVRRYDQNHYVAEESAYETPDTSPAAHEEFSDDFVSASGASRRSKHYGYIKWKRKDFKGRAKFSAKFKRKVCTGGLIEAESYVDFGMTHEVQAGRLEFKLEFAILK